MEVPTVGFGTMEDDAGAEAMYAATKSALNAGARLLDTAEMYESLPHVGRALAESEVSREEIFIVSKVTGLPVGSYDDVRARVQAILSALQVQFVDCLLIHHPGPRDLDLVAAPNAEKASWEYFRNSIEESWRNMLRLQADGLTRHIGVSNFYKHHLQEMESRFEDGSGKPFLNEIFIDVTTQEEEFVREMQGAGIHVVAYRPLAFLQVYGFLEHLAAKMQEQAERAGASSSQQLVLAWLASRGICAIPKSKQPSHIEANLKAHTLKDKVDADGMKQFNGGEEVQMYGGVDEYAMLFRSMAPA